MKTTLYRFFSGDDLLYVGVSMMPANRIQSHFEKSEWCNREEISAITLEHFESKREALSAEKSAIENELPFYNRAHSLIEPKEIGRPGARKPKVKMTVDEAVMESGAGSDYELAQILGVTRQAVSMWRKRGFIGYAYPARCRKYKRQDKAA